MLILSKGANDVTILGWKEKLFKKILEKLPEESMVTKIVFEGPKIVIYSKNPQLLLLKQDLIREIAKTYHKRISIRSDPSVRLPKKEAEKLILEIAGDRARIKNIHFDDVTGQVYIEAEKPGVVIGPKGITRKRITLETRWAPVIVRAPPLDSNIVRYARKLEEITSAQRRAFLEEIGERIHRPYILKNNRVRVTVLGGGREVGGNAILIQTRESSILVDAGIRVGASEPGEIFPRFNIPEFSIEELDAVIITHAHLDHSGMVPYLFKYGYRGPVYCTEPTKYLMALLQRDYIELARKEGRLSPYSYNDIDKELIHTITLNYEEVNDITPDIRLTLYNAGHILGSSIVHIHVAEGLYNIVIASDIKYSDTRLLDRAVTSFPRVETLIIEATYGSPRDKFPPREVAESELINIIKRVIERRGKVLIPVLAVGRAQEIMLILYHYMVKKKILPETPVYLSGMIKEAVAIHTANPEYLSRRLRDRILRKNENPFLAEFFVTVKDPADIAEISESSRPAIILATNGMLQGGPVLEFLKYLAEDERNALIFVSYQAPGTPGWNILRGARELMFYDGGSIRKMTLKMEVHQIRGFSGHSPFPELLKFVQAMKPIPQKVLVIHGEDKKCSKFAEVCRNTFKVDAIAPHNMETIRLL